MIYTFLCDFGYVCVTLLSKVVLPNTTTWVSENHKAVVYLTEKIRVLDKVFPGMSHRQHIGHEFDVSIIKIYIC